jgi:hypothetical protein
MKLKACHKRIWLQSIYKAQQCLQIQKIELTPVKHPVFAIMEERGSKIF